MDMFLDKTQIMLRIRRPRPLLQIYQAGDDLKIVLNTVIELSEDAIALQRRYPGSAANEVLG